VKNQRVRISDVENAGPSNVSVDTIREVRDQLDHLLGAVRSGELTSPSGLVVRLEGAITALDALLDSGLAPGDE
jgi:hypothetical protein